ncbi:NAD-dependent epimerase/dehydratase family protein [Pedobacter sp. UYP30]|uniref:NAD-dependent epimerase/dehydratase family protein n=1 Tax=Pedobacter sp. UYP30 TaxID=1756400 RepID=UPI0033957395
MEEKKQIFITGASGYIGQRLALQLAESGVLVHALVRNIDTSKKLLLHKNLVLFKGDIFDTDSILSAMKNCSEVYHLAALASVWNRDKKAFDRVNVTGLKNVIECAIKLKIKNFLFTSTAGVIGDSWNGKPVAEASNTQPKLETLYEQSKLKAEALLKSYWSEDFSPVMVNPSRVYGPGLLTESNGFTRLLKMYINGSWKINPAGGKSIGNYVFIDDVLDGMLSAMESAKPCQRYLLGGIDVSYKDFFIMVDEITGTKRKLYNAPMFVMLFVSRLQLMMAYCFNKQPLITPSFVRKYNKHWMVDSSKAKSELNYKVTPLKTGLKKTLEWLETKSL